MYIRAKLETKCPKGLKALSSEIRNFLGSNSLALGHFSHTKNAGSVNVQGHQCCRIKYLPTSAFH